MIGRFMNLMTTYMLWTIPTLGIGPGACIWMWLLAYDELELFDFIAAFFVPFYGLYVGFTG